MLNGFHSPIMYVSLKQIYAVQNTDKGPRELCIQKAGNSYKSLLWSVTEAGASFGKSATEPVSGGPLHVNPSKWG